ncbi:MAG: CmpA/NrtA family ABC transporter substrate-binding protein [Minwuia sp.]|nr:CmpA/NrtA family ABC transporter substrate-binding protein [Minwuia sp.]
MNMDRGRDGHEVVRAGFLPLVDAAPLIVAARRGMAAAEAIDLRLLRQPSWASIRDRINVGHLDVAQMLAGMPLAASLGINHLKVPTVASFAFGRGGNVIALSRGLFAGLDGTGQGWRDGPLAAGLALRDLIRQRAAAGEAPLVLAMVFPFSSHNYELRYWLAASGIDPDTDVRIVVIPPSMMVDSLRAGQVDGFCVGEPWGSLAVDAGLAAIVALKHDIWPDAPEKVLGARKVWTERHPDLLRRLLRALHAGAEWCQDPANRDDLVSLLADEAHVGAPVRILRRALTGNLVIHPDGTIRQAPDFLRFGGGRMNLPDADAATWVLSQMMRWGQVDYSEQAVQMVGEVYRADLLAGAAGFPAGVNGRDHAPLMDGHYFDPDNVRRYLGELRPTVR